VFTILDEAIIESGLEKKIREALNKGIKISMDRDRSKTPPAKGAKKSASPKKAEKKEKGKSKSKGKKSKSKGKKSKADGSPKPEPPFVPLVPELTLDEKKKAFKFPKQFKCSESAWRWRRTF
jgi:hypothetical protein